MHIIQNFFVRVSALTAFVIAFSVIGIDEAQAVKMKMDTAMGQIDLSVDTIASVGVSVRTSPRDYDWISSANGGRDGVRDLPACGDANFGRPGCLAVVPTATGGIVRFKSSADNNFAGNQNVDDGRINFDQGDVTALTLKVLTDIQADLPTEYGDFTAFMRLTAYADPILRRNSSYERVGLDDAAKRELGRDVKILDGYLSWDWDLPVGAGIGDLPFNLRVGKLTTNNWGEATFSLSGIAASIVVDVPAARRAGAEIKEVIQPEYMIYGSIGLPFDISVDAYYQFHHTIWNLDVSSSPTATSDVGNPGNAQGGFLWLSGSSTTGTFRRNCALPGAPCSTDSLVHFQTKFDDPGYANRTAEQWRTELGELNVMPISFVDADDQGQWGVRFSYYLDSLTLIPSMGDAMGGFMSDSFVLPGIEFTFSYQNVHSRVPYVQVRSAGRPTLTLAVQGGTSTAGAISLAGAGCAGTSAGAAAVGAPGAAGIRGLLAGLGALGATYNLDPRHFADISDVQAFVNLRAPADPDAGDDAPPAPAITNTPLSLFDAGCRVVVAQSSTALPAALSAALPGGGVGGLPVVGAETLSLQHNSRLDFFYPEDIKILGFGFNTTIPWLEWGLQGEVSWRPDMPLQVDTTEQIIGSAFNQCIQWGLGVVGASLNPQATQTGCTAAAFTADPVGTVNNIQNYVAIPFVESSMINFTIGATALYTGSDPLVSLLRADQLIVLGEYNVISFDKLPTAPSSRTQANAATGTVGNLQEPSLACIARSGTELPLGGLLGLDTLGNEECTADEISMGYTILALIDYNNVFGTAWRLRPSLALRHGVRGNTPSPVPGWREDTFTVTAAVEANFQNTWTMRASYIGYFDFGSGDYNGNSGNDTFSFNVSYAF